MKKVKFEFNRYKKNPIIEIFEFDDATPEVIIKSDFEEWFFDELDRQGIEGYYEEID